MIASDLQPSSALTDFKTIYDSLRRLGLLDSLRKLQTPSAVLSVLSLALDWGLILGSWALCFYVSWWWLPLSLVITGSRQRALGNLQHDAGHKMLFARRRVNDWVSTLTISLPFLTLLPYYREMHFAHHAYLGSAEEDPELIHREEDRGKNAWRLFLVHFLDLEIVKGAAVGDLPRMRWSERLAAAAWWAAFLGLFGLLLGWPAAGTLAALWFGARVTTFHAVTTFREISDHVGLVPGTILSFTRNSPHGTFWSFLIHPHQNNYHLTHHLAPRVPFPRLKTAHRLLMQVPEYAEAHHCDVYFHGTRSLIACWVGRCFRWHRKEA